MDTLFIPTSTHVSAHHLSAETVLIISEIKFDLGFNHRYRLEISNLDMFYFFTTCGTIWGCSGFAHDQNNMWFIQWMCQTSVSDFKDTWNVSQHARQKDITQFGRLCGCILYTFVFVCFVSKNWNTPKWSSMRVMWFFSLG